MEWELWRCAQNLGVSGGFSQHHPAALQHCPWDWGGETKAQPSPRIIAIRRSVLLCKGWGWLYLAWAGLGPEQSQPPQSMLHLLGYPESL